MLRSGASGMSEDTDWACTDTSATSDTTASMGKSASCVCSTSVRFAGDRVDLSNVSTWELHHGCCALVGSVGSNQYLDSRRLGLGEGSREIRNLIARRLVPVWIRKMTIRYENR